MIGENGMKASVFIVLFMLLSQPVWALRCEGRVAEPGYSKQDVYDVCGEPDSINSHYERRGSSNYAEFGQYNNPGYRGGQNFNFGQNNYREIEVLVEDWEYDFGHSRLRQHLRFENGQLKEVTDTGRGRRR